MDPNDDPAVRAAVRDLHTQSIDQLTEDQRRAINEILWATPVVALASQEVHTFDDVIKNLTSVSDHLKKVMKENMKLKEDAQRIDADFKATRRILGRLGLTS